MIFLNHRICFFVLSFMLLSESGLPAQPQTGNAVQHAATDNQSVAKDSLTTKNPTGAMLRSLAVPGWGQFYNGKWFKGILVVGAETGLVANAIVLNQWAKNSATEDERLYYLDNRNLSFWILGAVILYSMADAYVDAELFDFDESPDLSFNVRSNCEPLAGITFRTINLGLVFHL